MTRALSDFHYVTYIRTTPERLWEAITDAEIRRKFQFGNAITSDWTPGSRIEITNPKAPGLLGEGENLEVDPPRRLVQSMVGFAESTFNSVFNNFLNLPGIARVGEVDVGIDKTQGTNLRNQAPYGE
jgi:hypothetical protein